ncbi:hypothetical protein TNCV_1517261 [Trichonephila clavipes]|nr:hypothetical protein TNCV_1517261 [Trichonephila clavipes]
MWIERTKIRASDTSKETRTARLQERTSEKAVFEVEEDPMYGTGIADLKKKSQSGITARAESCVKAHAVLPSCESFTLMNLLKWSRPRRQKISIVLTSRCRFSIDPCIPVKRAESSVRVYAAAP